MNTARKLAIICMGLWLGGIFFFAAGVAPSVLDVLTPVQHGRGLAADIVGRSILTLHITGVVCGIVALIVLLLDRVHDKIAIPLIGLAVALTLFSQFGVVSRMKNLHPEGLRFSELPQDDPRLEEFRSLHTVSTVMEGVIFLCGAVALYRMGGSPRES